MRYYSKLKAKLGIIRSHEEAMRGSTYNPNPAEENGIFYSSQIQMPLLPSQKLSATLVSKGRLDSPSQQRECYAPKHRKTGVQLETGARVKGLPDMEGEGYI